MYLEYEAREPRTANTEATMKADFINAKRICSPIAIVYCKDDSSHVLRNNFYRETPRILREGLMKNELEIDFP